MASGLYAGYLAALLAVGLLAARTGPRLPVLAGLLSAGVGTALVALSPNPAVLAAGVVLAGTGAGWSWAPYNDAVGRTLPASSRDRVLSVISTGTTLGVALTGLAALGAAAYGLPWRAAWFAFAAGSLAGYPVNQPLSRWRGVTSCNRGQRQWAAAVTSSASRLRSSSVDGIRPSRRSRWDCALRMPSTSRRASRALPKLALCAIRSK